MRSAGQFSLLAMQRHSYWRLSDVALLSHSFAFDVSVWEIFVHLAAAVARLMSFAQEARYDARKLSARFVRNRITM